MYHILPTLLIPLLILALALCVLAVVLKKTRSRSFAVLPLIGDAVALGMLIILCAYYGHEAREYGDMLRLSLNFGGYLLYVTLIGALAADIRLCARR